MDKLVCLQSLYEKASIDPTCEYSHMEELFVGMSDGIHLRTQVFYPKGKNKVPVILQRSCYPFQEET